MSEFLTKEEMNVLIKSELNQMDAGLKEYAESILIPINKRVLKWEYGSCEECLAWEIADFKQRNVRAAYCLEGHGRCGYPWGLVFDNEDCFGSDAGWYDSFESMLLDGWYVQIGSKIN